MSDRPVGFVEQMHQGFIAFAPLAIAVLPFGMVSGVTAVSVGLSPLEAIAMAVGIYSGAAQLAIVGAGLGMWLAWEIGSAVGIALGAKILARWQLDFAIPLVFLGLLRPAVRDRPAVAAMVASGTVAVLAHAWPHNLGMVAAALVGITVGLISEGRRSPPA